MSKVITTELQHSGASSANITLDSSKNVTCENNLQVDGNVTVTGTLPADKLTGNLPAISGASLTGLPSSPPAGRNILINGDMRIAQRATSSSDQGCKTTDRFYYDKGGTNETPQQAQRALTSADTGPWAKGFRWCYKITNGNQSALDATDYVRFKYITENRDIHQSGWEYTDPNSKVTISFWVKSSVSQRFYFALRTSEGTGQHYAHPFTPAANTWTYVTHTIPGNANNVFGDNNGHGLMLQWQLAIGSSYTDDSFTDDAWGVYQTNQFKDYNDGDNDWYETDDATWEITGVQFEAGDTATDFEFKRYDDELRRCKRYYHKRTGHMMMAPYKVMDSPDMTRKFSIFYDEMTAAPTVSGITHTTNGTTSVSVDTAYIDHVEFESGDVSDSTYVRIDTYQATAEFE